MKSVARKTLTLALSALLLGACVPAKKAQIRVATATAAELEAAHGKDDVWYEFQPGDVIPVRFAFFGAFEGGAETPVVFRAKQHVYFVMSKNQPMRISFDGKTFAGESSHQSIIAMMPRDDGPGGQVGWVMYIGASGKPKAELQKLIDDKRAAAPKKP